MKGKPGTAPVREPQPFVLCFESRAAAKTGRPWAVKIGTLWGPGRWRLAREVTVQVPTLTVYKGADAPQPRAFLTGFGVVRALAGGSIVITG